jgi:PKD repeat protein
MKQTYKLIFIALLLLGLCVGMVQATEYSRIIPTMTSNTAPTGNSSYVNNITATADAYFLYDGSTATELYLPAIAPTFLPIITGINTSYYSIAHRYAIYPYQAGTTFSPQSWTFEGSVDNINYDVLDTQTVYGTWLAGYTNFTISNTVPYKSYRLVITAIGGATFDVKEVVVYGEATNLPIVYFTATPSVGIPPLQISLNDTTISASPITFYNASFGDGDWYNDTTFPATNITHVYGATGNYTVDWYVTNAKGTGSASTTITVWGAVHSAFSMFNSAGTAPHTTYLYDQSTNLTPGPATYAWDLGDGNTSTEANTYFTWNATGTYNVTHTVSNGLSSEASFITVTVGTPTPPVVAPVASFYGSPTTGNVPLTVSFTDVSSNTPTSWNWSFGDGIYSELQNPSHSYNRSGFRTVNLTATNSAGSNITVRAKFVKVS